MLLAAAVMVPTVWLPDLKSLSYLGFLGITATLTVTGAVAYTLLTGAPLTLISSIKPCSLTNQPICIWHAASQIMRGKLSLGRGAGKSATG